MATDDRRCTQEARNRTDPPRIKLSELLAGARESIIEHDGHEYRLRATSNGMLILTK